MDSKPVKCLCCDTWNFPDAKFCRSCGADIETQRQLQQIEEEIEMREKILEEWGVTEDASQNTNKSDNGGCASVIILVVAISGIISFLI